MDVSLVGISPYCMKGCPAHSHHEWEIVLNLEGEGVTFVGDREYPFYPGMIICYPPDIPHYKVAKGTFKDLFVIVGGVVTAGSDVAVFEDDEEKSLETLMYLALRIFHKKEPNSRNIVNSLVNTMYQLLLSRQTDKPKNERVELFKNCLINNFSDPGFRICDAVKDTAYSDDYFRRCFKRETGVTPADYLLDLRINYAKKLLAEGGNVRMRVSDIALHSGFYDSHYFSRIFKKRVGMSPSEYALKNQEK